MMKIVKKMKMKMILTLHRTLPPSLIPTSCIQHVYTPPIYALIFFLVDTHVASRFVLVQKIIMLWEGNHSWYYDSKVPLEKHTCIDTTLPKQVRRGEEGGCAASRRQLTVGPVLWWKLELTE